MEKSKVEISELGQAALDYAAMGLAVFPLAENTKVPAIAGGFKNATTDPEQIRAFWEHRPNCNVGIATGGASGGLVVIDCDYDEMRGEDGMATLRKHEKEHGELPDGACVSTPRGGEHVYLICSEPFDCSTNQNEGIDIRADGGYVVAPPSVNERGAYEWDMHIDDYGIPEANESALAFIRKMQSNRARRRKFELPKVIKVGERDDVLFRYACWMQREGFDDAMILATIDGTNRCQCEKPLPDAQVKKVVESALKYEKGNKVGPMPGNSGAVSTMLRVNEKGNPYQTISNCETVLNNDVRLAGRFLYDEMAYTKMVECPVPWDRSSCTRAVADSDYASLTAYMEREYLLTKKASIIDAVLTTCRANRRNAVAEWLASLEWDGEERIHALLPLFLGAECNEYNTEVMRLFMRAAISRVLEPGCKFDHMLVLAGAQGIGKSTFLRKLAHDPQWFDGNFNTVDGEAAVERLRGMWIVEMAELLSIKSSKAIESVKSFITNQVDSIRPKYGKETEQRPRVCVLAGTTNDGSFLVDPTGNRRFLIVECKAKAPTAELFEDSAQELFDKCWAEAYARYMDGERSLVLPERVAQAANDVRSKYTEDDPRVGVIQEYVDAVIQHATALQSVRVCVVEIMRNALHMEEQDCRNPPKRLVNEIHEILRNRVDGLMPYGDGKGKLRTPYGVQRCYVIDLESPHVAETRQQGR